MISINKLIGGSITITTKPVGNPKTKITFMDRTSQEYDWSGEITKQMMIDAGLYDPFQSVWIKGQGPQIVEIGTNVTSISSQAFQECGSLTSVTISDSVTSIRSKAFWGCVGLMSVTISESVTSIGSRAFNFCNNLTSVTFSGKDKATVQGMANYSWGLTSGCVISCTDGDITL